MLSNIFEHASCLLCVAEFFYRIIVVLTSDDLIFCHFCHDESYTKVTCRRLLMHVGANSPRNVHCLHSGKHSRNVVTKHEKSGIVGASVELRNMEIDESLSVSSPPVAGLSSYRSTLFGRGTEYALCIQQENHWWLTEKDT